MKGHDGSKHYAQRIMPQGMLPPDLSSATFCAESIGAVYFGQNTNVWGVILMAKSKKCLKH